MTRLHVCENARRVTDPILSLPPSTIHNRDLTKTLFFELTGCFILVKYFQFSNSQYRKKNLLYGLNESDSKSYFSTYSAAEVAEVLLVTSVVSPQVNDLFRVLHGCLFYHSPVHFLCTLH